MVYGWAIKSASVENQYENWCTFNAVCVHVTCTVVTVHAICEGLVDRYLSVTPVNQLQRQLGVRSFSSWCYTWSGFDGLPKKAGWL